MMSESEKKKPINMIDTSTWIISPLLLIKGVIFYQCFLYNKLSHTFVIEIVIYTRT